jgi:hypothetical protein
MEVPQRALGYCMDCRDCNSVDNEDILPVQLEVGDMSGIASTYTIKRGAAQLQYSKVSLLLV